MSEDKQNTKRKATSSDEAPSSSERSVLLVVLSEDGGLETWLKTSVFTQQETVLLETIKKQDAAENAETWVPELLLTKMKKGSNETMFEELYGQPYDPDQFRGHEWQKVTNKCGITVERPTEVYWVRDWC